MILYNIIYIVECRYYDMYIAEYILSIIHVYIALYTICFLWGNHYYAFRIYAISNKHAMHTRGEDEDPT